MGAATTAAAPATAATPTTMPAVLSFFLIEEPPGCLEGLALPLADRPGIEFEGLEVLPESSHSESEVSPCGWSLAEAVRGDETAELEVSDCRLTVRSAVLSGSSEGPSLRLVDLIGSVHVVESHGGAATSETNRKSPNWATSSPFGYLLPDLAEDRGNALGSGAKPESSISAAISPCALKPGSMDPAGASSAG